MHKTISKKVRKDDRGTSMILIIILIAFLAILLTVLMTNTMMNYRMKVSEVHARDNFYKAEASLEKTRAEIAMDVSGALEKSYTSVMTADEEMSVAERAEAFRTSFRKELLKVFPESSDVSVYEDRIVLKGYAAQHTDADGYSDRIRTDIAIRIPDDAYFHTHAVMDVKDLVVYENFTQN